MNMFFDWWFATSPRLRQLCWAFWLLMLVTLIFLSSTHHEAVSYTHLTLPTKRIV